MPEQKDKYFVSVQPVDDIPPTDQSLTAFSTAELAMKDAAKKNSFRSRLLNACQQDFEAATLDSGVYEGVAVMTASFKEREGKMSAEEKAAFRAEIELCEMKLKRRILGTIRFIGEIYKKGLVKSNIMFSCFSYLIGDEESGWKKDCDEQNIEMLCKLLRTVGQQLESKSGKYKNEFIALFHRLHELSGDKRLSTRTRFTIQEVLELKLNYWQERREQEVPLTVAEIRQKAAQEEHEQQMAQQRPVHYPSSHHQGTSAGRYVHTGSQQSRGSKPDVRILAYSNREPSLQNTKASPSGILSRPIASTGKTAPSIALVPRDITLKAESVDLQRLERSVKVIIEEFIANGSEVEVFESMDELPVPISSGVFVTCCLDKVLGTNKQKDRAAISTLLDLVSPRFLVPYSQAILSALTSFDPLVALCETVLDIKEVKHLTR